MIVNLGHVSQTSVCLRWPFTSEIMSLPPGITSDTAMAEVEMGTRLCVRGERRKAAYMYPKSTLRRLI